MAARIDPIGLQKPCPSFRVGRSEAFFTKEIIEKGL